MKTWYTSVSPEWSVAEKRRLPFVSRNFVLRVRCPLETPHIFWKVAAQLKVFGHGVTSPNLNIIYPQTNIAIENGLLAADLPVQDGDFHSVNSYVSLPEGTSINTPVYPSIIHYKQLSTTMNHYQPICGCEENSHAPLDVCSALLGARVAVRGHLEHSPAVSPFGDFCASDGGEHVTFHDHHPSSTVWNRHWNIYIYIYQ